METDTIIKVMELESPVDRDIQIGLEIQLKIYTDRLINPKAIWAAGKCLDNYKAHIKFQDGYDKYFIIVMLTKRMGPGQIILVSSIRDELVSIFGSIDMETFDNAVNTVYMYLTRQLPLPNARTAYVAQPS